MQSIGMTRFRLSIMRKRKYGHRTDSIKIDDVLVEDIDAVYDQQRREDSDMPQANIHNLVGTAKIACSVKPLKLQHICRLLPNTHFDKQKFAAITIRLTEPPCTTLLFTSGKMVLTGCRDFMQCVLASHEIVRLLKEGIKSVKFKLLNVHVQNIVGNVDLSLKNQIIDLDRIYQENNIYCECCACLFVWAKI